MTCAVVGEEPESDRLPETLDTHIGPTVLNRGTAWSWAGSVGRPSMRPPALLHERAKTSLAKAGTGISTKASTPKNSGSRFVGNKGSSRETKTEPDCCITRIRYCDPDANVQSGERFAEQSILDTPLPRLSTDSITSLSTPTVNWNHAHLRLQTLASCWANACSARKVMQLVGEHSTSYRSSHDYNFLAIKPGRRFGRVFGPGRGAC